MNPWLARLSALLVPLGSAFAQSNADPGIDLRLANMTDLVVFERSGTFPSGVNACAFETTVCNTGTTVIPWLRPMSPEHPFIGFLVAREVRGRFEQISDRSYVKHGFFPKNFEHCGTCEYSSGALGIGCSDTYVAGNNGDTSYLGPPDEVDPWLGTWEPFCSHFDRGQPADPPERCDGDYGNVDGSLDFHPRHCLFVRDADLTEPRVPYWFQAMYVVRGESEAKRGDDLGSRAFTPVWKGSGWDLVESGPMLLGSVLQRWIGAKVSSSTNGADDGRIYVGVKVTGPDPADGFYHYEYAVHERDNARGVAALRIPVSRGARVRALGFRDVDMDAANDWSAAVAGDEIVFSTMSNPLKWNTIFNFWFDSDAAPAPDALRLDAAGPGPGAPFVSVVSHAPLALRGVFLGLGCGLDAPPTLFANGSPTPGNASFSLQSSGNAPFQPSFLRGSFTSGSYSLGGCPCYLGPAPGLAFPCGSALADAAGHVVFAAPLPNDLALEGLDLHLQSASRHPGLRAVRGFDLSDGLLVRIGREKTGRR